MTGVRASIGVLTLAACLMFLNVLMLQAVQAQAAGLLSSTPVEHLIHFELAAQPLADAVDAYTRITNRSVLVDNRLLAQRVSAAVDGDYLPNEALQHMLAGTGLAANLIDATSDVILPALEAPHSMASDDPLTLTSTPAIAGISASDDDYRAYAGMVQMRLARALCQSPQTRPGNFRLLVQLRIDDSGALAAARLVGSTGVPARDAEIVRAMRALTFDSAPPAGLPEPITILIRPQRSGMVDDCAQPGVRD